jgi:hypothetical protein
VPVSRYQPEENFQGENLAFPGIQTQKTLVFQVSIAMSIISEELFAHILVTEF